MFASLTQQLSSAIDFSADRLLVAPRYDDPDPATRHLRCPHHCGQPLFQAARTRPGPDRRALVRRCVRPDGDEQRRGSNPMASRRASRSMSAMAGRFVPTPISGAATISCSTTRSTPQRRPTRSAGSPPAPRSIPIIWPRPIRRCSRRSPISRITAARCRNSPRRASSSTGRRWSYRAARSASRSAANIITTILASQISLNPRGVFANSIASFVVARRQVGLWRIAHPDLRGWQWHAGPALARAFGFGPVRRLQRQWRHDQSQDRLHLEAADQLTIRGNYGTSFHAPSLADTTSTSDSRAQIILFSPFRPSTSPGSDFNRPTIVLAGGNPELKPEKANTWSLGFDWKPTMAPGLIVSADLLQRQLQGCDPGPAVPVAGALLESGLFELLHHQANAGAVARGGRQSVAERRVEHPVALCRSPRNVSLRADRRAPQQYRRDQGQRDRFQCRLCPSDRVRLDQYRRERHLYAQPQDPGGGRRSRIRTI